MHQPALHLDTEEPSLVPQWLKDGVLKRNGCSTRHARTGSQDTVRRVPSLGVSWESSLSGSAGQSSSQDNTTEEHTKSNGSRLGKGQSLRGGSATKHSAGAGWPSKPRQADRFNSFERINGHERSNSGISDHWPQSPDIRASAAPDTRSDWNYTKDFAPRSSLLYSPKHSEEAGVEKPEAPFDKEFPSLHSTSAGGSSSAALENDFPALGASSAASSKPGHTWISSVTDSTTGHSSAVKRSARTPFNGQNGLRMAEALANAAANGTAADSEKAAREQLAVKQSKQLVPVIATNKHKGLARHVVDTKLNSVIDARKELASTASRALDRLGSAERPDAKRPNGMLTLKPQTSLKLSARQLNRTTFFESLKRTSSVGSDSLENHSPAEHKLSRLAGAGEQSSSTNRSIPVVNESKVDEQSEESQPEVPELVTSLPQDSNEMHSGEDHGELKSDSAQCNGHVESATEENSARLTPEEEAFLRSLGWTDASDDEDYALTEEEIAAFKASVGGRNLLPVKPKVSLLPLSPHSIFDQHISTDSDSSSSDSDMY